MIEQNKVTTPKPITDRFYKIDHIYMIAQQHIGHKYVAIQTKNRSLLKLSSIPKVKIVHKNSFDLISSLIVRSDHQHILHMPAVRSNSCFELKPK